MKKRWTIGTVAEHSGVPASTIRYYEQIELLPPADRVNGRRRYDDAILETLDIEAGAPDGSAMRGLPKAPGKSGEG